MAKPRVYELAKDLNVDSKTVLEKLKDMGEFVKSASSTIEPPVARRLKAAFDKDDKGDAKPAASAQKPAAKPAQHKPAAAATHQGAAPAVATPGPRPQAERPAAPAPARHNNQHDNGGRPSRQGQGRPNGNRQGQGRPNGGQPGQHQNNRGGQGSPRPTAGGNASNAIPRPHAQGPRPGNNPFSRKQGMHSPTPGDIPRPHPMARPTTESGRGGRPGRPGQGQGQGRGGFRGGRPGQGGQGGPRPGQWGHNRPGQGGAAQGGGARGGFRGGQGGGSNFQGGGAPSNGPARGGGRGGRGGTAGAFGRQGGKSSKARKNRLAKRHEYEELKAPTIGGVRIPNGNGQTIRLRQGASLADLAEKINVNQAALVTVLFHLGQMATATQSLDEETFQILGEEIGWNIQLVSAEEEDKELLQQFDINLDEEELQDDEDLKPRPPVVTVMGHVDHGKTRLLDTIRKTNVIAREAGGITQRIGAYQVTVDLEGEPRKITFLDTPGHEAFTAMRARGAELTDVAILVVAADDGVMPQTVEAINHAQAAKVPIVVAVNKIDVPNPDMDARGATVEARLDKGRGAVATVLVQSGTLHVGDAIVAGTSYGRVRAMLDENGRAMDAAGPSTPVQVLGLTSVPTAGDLFLVASDDRAARQIAEKRQATERAAQLAKRRKVVSLEDFKKKFAESEIDMLNIVIKGDSSGSVEALEDSLMSVKEGYEAGINLGTFNDIELGDIIETFEMQEVERK